MIEGGRRAGEGREKERYLSSNKERLALSVTGSSVTNQRPNRVPNRHIHINPPYPKQYSTPGWQDGYACSHSLTQPSRWLNHTKNPNIKAPTTTTGNTQKHNS